MNRLQRLLGRRKSPEIDPEELDKQLRRMSKELYKWNAMVDSQAEQTRLALESAQQTIRLMERDRASIAVRERLSLVKALFPLLDGIEAGIARGMAQIEALRAGAPAAADTLAAWLDGQRLLLERLNALLDAEGVKPIPTVGQVFNPYRHVVVKTAYDPTCAPDVVLLEERRGYMLNDDVLRFADVVVNKKEEQNHDDPGN